MGKACVSVRTQKELVCIFFNMVVGYKFDIRYVIQLDVEVPLRSTSAVPNDHHLYEHICTFPLFQLVLVCEDMVQRANLSKSP